MGDKMMKSALTAVVALLFLQVTNANMFSEVKEETQKVMDDLSTIFERSQGLLELVQTVDSLHREASNGPFGMDLEACENLTTSLLKAQGIIAKAFHDGFGAFKTIAVKLNDLLNCPGINPIKAVTCMMDDIKAVKQAVDSVKPTVEQFKDQIENSYVEIHAEALECIGFDP